MLRFVIFGGYKIYSNGDIFRFLPNGCEIILKPWVDMKGYRIVWFNGKCVKVHRLVSMAFIPNHNNLPEVNHIDEDKSNNDVSNLEWSSAKQNSNHGSRNSRISDGNSLSICQIDPNNGLCIKVYNSLKSTKEYGFRPKSITEVLSGRDLSSRGFHWEYLYKYILSRYMMERKVDDNLKCTFDVLDDPLFGVNVDNLVSNTIIVYDVYNNCILSIFKDINEAILFGYNKWMIKHYCSFDIQNSNVKWYYLKNFLKIYYNIQ